MTILVLWFFIYCSYVCLFWLLDASLQWHTHGHKWPPSLPNKVLDQVWIGDGRIGSAARKEGLQVKGPPLSLFLSFHLLANKDKEQLWQGFLCCVGHVLSVLVLGCYSLVAQSTVQWE